MLYVAATRARQQLWFFDEVDSDASAPMRAYFEHKGVICYGDVAEMADLAKCSTPAEWGRQGEQSAVRQQRQVWYRLVQCRIDGILRCYSLLYFSE